MNSEINAETNKAVCSEDCSQISRKLEEVKMDLNVRIREAINLAIEEKVLPTIQNALNLHKAASSEKLDLRSDGPHQSKFGRTAKKCDPRSDRPQQSVNGGVSCKSRVDLPKVDSLKNNRNNYLRERVQ